MLLWKEFLLLSRYHFQNILSGSSGLGSHSGDGGNPNSGSGWGTTRTHLS
uniref:Uncharacterized protein n=2 Tax=Klebsiella pneumoniae TaxID=573 RepID=A0A5P1PNB8_KLEPN|nr:hypothetical protein [Klebsiella pneumoniae]QXV89921.1 hypothetical protein [Klebsiella pneumoniae subsp. pneumoniae]UNB12504.1 hypothetical protein [Escherichia coli]QVQ57512.1 hypothetical protein [Klebsiella pneumoniae]UNB12839.1 hypothetical protein [Escherichia coli]